MHAAAPAQASDAQLRFIDAWEVEPLDDGDAIALLRECALGRHCYVPIIQTGPHGSGNTARAARAAAAVEALTQQQSPQQREQQRTQPSPSRSRRASFRLLERSALAEQTFLWAALRCDAWLVSAIASALPPPARAGDSEADDEQLAGSCRAWPPLPSAIGAGELVLGATEPFRARLRRYLYRNGLFRRAQMNHRFTALVQVDLVALENLTDSLAGGGGQHHKSHARQQPGAAVPNANARAVLRLKHCKPPGGGASPPLSEKLRTRDSAVACASRHTPAQAAAHSERSDVDWGVSAAFRFALPDEALPEPLNFAGGTSSAGTTGGSASSLGGGVRRMPTRGPPQVVHVCVYQRVANPIFGALGMAPTEIFLGDVEVPLEALTDDEPLMQWLPLRGATANTWFVHIRICLRFLLMALKEPTQEPNSKRTSSLLRSESSNNFSDFGDDESEDDA